MATYKICDIRTPARLGPNKVVLVASGDLRQSANWVCWPAQQAMEEQLAATLAEEGVTVRRGHPYDPYLEHGFIWSQRMGMDVFKTIPSGAPLIVAEAAWQYSHHVLAGLRSHRGPILTVGNWSAQWPGLAGMLNLNGALTKIGVPYSTLWSEDFTDDFFRQGLRQWLCEGRISHDTSHVHALDPAALPAAEAWLGTALARQLQNEKAIIGVFDEGCMGMYNAIIDDEMLNPCGIYKERLSQAGLVAAMRDVTDAEADAVRDWLAQQMIGLS